MRMVGYFDLGTASDLTLDVPRFVRFDGPPPKRSILVVRTQSGVRAYWNVCQHLPIPLDCGAGTLPKAPEPGELMCATHGARYRAEDGLCIAGPCKGAILEEITIEVDRENDRVLARL